MMRFHPIFYLFILLFNVGKSQTKLFGTLIHPDVQILKYDTNYICPNLNKLTLRAYVNLKQNEMGFLVKGDPIKYQYEVRDELRYGVGFGYRWLILNGAYHFNPQKNIKKYDLQLNITGKRFLYDIRSQWYKGYHVSPGEFREDVQLISLGGSLRYNFNHKKYSFKGSFDQTQWQKKSAGTPLLGINFNYNRILTDSLLHLGSSSDLLKLEHETLHFGVGGGYSYTYVYKQNWFATFSLMVYLEEQFNGVSENSAPKLDLKIVPEPRLAAGYNCEKYYIGLTGIFHQLPAQLSDDVAFMYKFNTIKIIYARRFDFDVFKNKANN